MSKRNNDIEQQIRKYLNGELDARAMHQLEKEAQNDPFLMEALEGYENSNRDQQKNIDEINARLQTRVTKDERRIIPWRIIAIAASVLIMVGVGGFFIKNYHSDEKPKAVALLDKAKFAPVDTFKAAPPQSKYIAANAPKMAEPKASHVVYPPRQKQDKFVAQGNPSAVAEIASNAPNPSPQVTAVDTVKLAEVKIIGYPTQRKNSVTGSVTTITGKDITVENRLSGKVAGVNISKSKALSGIVKDESGQPLPGVSVTIKGTAIGTQTNTDGYFKLDSVPNRSTLSVNYIGYNKKEVSVAKHDSLVIAMQPNSQSLNDVVVVGYGTQRQEYQSAHPQNGWDEFKKYLKDNAISPDRRTGTVKLSFMVNSDNSLSDFKIIKSVSAKTDSAAIDLVNDGPGWIRNTDNKPEKVKLSIKFTVQ